MRKLQLVLAGLVGLLLSGCVAVGFFIPTKGVPKVPETTVPESSLVDVDMRVEEERRSGMRKTGKRCSGGECEDLYTNKTWFVKVNVAKASVDGRPLSIGEVATAYPDFVAQDRDIRAAKSACTRGKTTIGIGVLAALVGAYLLQKGEDDSAYKTPAYATIGGGVGVMAAGYLFMGYRRCDDWLGGLRKWKGVYAGPSDTEVRGDRALLLKELAERLNGSRNNRVSPGKGKAPANTDPVDVQPESPEAPVDPTPDTSSTATCSAALVSKGLEKKQDKADKLCAKYTAAQIAKAEELVDFGIRDSFSSLLKDVAQHTDKQIECAKKAWAADGKKRSFSVKKACR